MSIEKSVRLVSRILSPVIILLLAYYLIRASVTTLASLDSDVTVGILAASATVITATLTVVLGRYYERKKEVESHFRTKKTAMYDELLKMWFDIFSGKSEGDNIVGELREWHRNLVLWSDPLTMQAYVKWNLKLKTGGADAESFMLMDDLFRAIRKDLGLSNRGLARGFSSHLMLRHSELFLAAAAKNPSVTLSELADLERELGLEGEPDATQHAGQDPSRSEGADEKREIH